MRHVIFQVEKERYGLPLEAVREVFSPPTVFSRVPAAPPPIRGVINLRGRVVTVVDLRMLLGLPDGATKSEKIILLDQGRRDLGLLVSEVEGIESLEKISPSPGRTTPAVRGVARLRRSAITILDIEGINGAVTALFPKRTTG